jgi:hypothetical protein
MRPITALHTALPLAAEGFIAEVEDVDRDGDDGDLQGATGQANADQNAAERFDGVVVGNVLPLCPLRVNDAARVADILAGRLLEAREKAHGFLTGRLLDGAPLLLAERLRRLACLCRSQVGIGGAAAFCGPFNEDMAGGESDVFAGCKFPAGRELSREI